MVKNNGGAALRAHSIRLANLSTVLQAVRLSGPMSRSRLVATTGLTRTAIAGIVGELVGLGLLRESAATSDGSPGRPSPIASVDERQIGVLSIDIVVDEIAVAIVGLDGNIVCSRRRSRLRNRVSVSETVTDIVDLVRQLGITGEEIEGRQLIGVGVSVAGLVEAATGVVVRAPNLDWVDVDLGALLIDKLGLSLPISVANDGDLGALAEARFGSGVGAGGMVFVQGEVGVGGGIVLNGKRVGGQSGFAGEVGHIPVNPRGRACQCGSRGCWETEIGEQALLRRGGRNPDGGAEAVAEMLSAALAGESNATEALEEQARWVAIGVAGLVNVFDPDVVVLGGVLSQILSGMRATLDEELATRAVRGISRTVRVVGGALGVDARLVGAAELAFEPLLDNPLWTALKSASRSA